MDNMTALLEIDAIKHLKARYCRCLDAKDWDAWRELFDDGFTSVIAGAGGRQTVGADDFILYVRRTIGKSSQPSVHQVYAPDITLTSATTATGVWALHDVVRLIPAVTLRGHGHYHETYEKIEGHWRIKTSTVTRLREDVTTGLPQGIATRLRIVAARVARPTSRVSTNNERD
jgi:hypothetical protein